MKGFIAAGFILNVPRRFIRSKIESQNLRVKKSLRALTIGAAAAAGFTGLLWLATRTPPQNKHETAPAAPIVQPREPAQKLLPVRIPATKEIILPQRKKKDLSDPHILTRQELQRYIEIARRKFKFGPAFYQIVNAKSTFDAIVKENIFEQKIGKPFDPTQYDFAKPDWSSHRFPERPLSKSALARLFQRGVVGIHHLARVCTEMEALWKSPIGTLVKFRYEGEDGPTEFFGLKVPSSKKGVDIFLTPFPHHPNMYTGFTFVYTEGSLEMLQRGINKVDSLIGPLTIDGIKMFDRRGYHSGKYNGLEPLLFYNILKVVEVFRPKHS